MTLKFKIEGGKELDRALKAIAPKFEKRIAKAAVRSGANVILKEARLRVPERSGALRKSLRVVARSRRVGDAVASVVTRSGKKWTSKGMNAWYAGKVEFGSKKSPAQPFLRPALDTKAKQAIEAMKDMITKKLGELV